MQLFFICLHCLQPYVTKSVLSGFFITCHKCQCRIQVPLESKQFPDLIEINPQDELDPRGIKRETLSTYDKKPKEWSEKESQESQERLEKAFDDQHNQKYDIPCDVEDP